MIVPKTMTGLGAHFHRIASSENAVVILHLSIMVSMGRELICFVHNYGRISQVNNLHRFLTFRRLIIANLL